MASKFQNRLVGTIVLVALGVIILPGLLDGQKKHYQEDFAAIPLVPKPGDRDEPDMLPAATQALPAQPPEGAAEEVKAGNAAAPSLSSSRLATNGNNFDDTQAQGPVIAPKPPATPPAAGDKPAAAQSSAPGKTASAPDKTSSSPTDNKAPPAPKSLDKLAPPTPVTVQAAPAKTQPPAAKPAAIPLPTGRAYVVQLGALRNADKANEIVSRLRSAGYKAYTSPSTPVQGQITRIMVGPDVSRDKLKDQLGELHQLTGLSGVVMGYSPN